MRRVVSSHQRALTVCCLWTASVNIHVGSKIHCCILYLYDYWSTVADACSSIASGGSVFSCLGVLQFCLSDDGFT
jgi:hypothetical protein